MATINTEQELVALEEATNAITRMVARGVSEKHIPGSALLMVGFAALEQTVSRKSISVWLESVAKKYRESMH